MRMKSGANGKERKRLPKEIMIELLRHMSEAGRFDQTLSEFPDLTLTEVRATFAWLAEQFNREAAAEEDPREYIREFSKDRLVSDVTRRVLDQLPPQESLALLETFGASLDDSE